MSDLSKPPASVAWLPLVQPFATLLAAVAGILFITIYLELDLKTFSLNIGGINAEMVKRIDVTQDKVDDSARVIGNELAELAEKVRVLEARLSTDTVRPLGVNPVPSQPPVPDADTGTQRSASELAPLFQKLPNRASPLFNKEGYIFIGNAMGDSVEEPNLRDKDGFVRRLSDLKVGSRYTTGAHLSLRSAYPGDNPAYYSGVPMLGVVTNGLSVVLIEAPKQAVRPSRLVQLWAKVRVAE